MINKLGIGVPLGLAGMTIGFSEIGEALGSEALQGAGEISGQLIKPAVVIGAGGFVVKQLKELQQNFPKNKRGFRL